MARDTLRVIARFVAKPGKADELRSVAMGLLAPTRREDGCLLYELLENEDDPNELTFVEEWRDGEALHAHMGTAHIEHARSRLVELVAVPLDLRRYKLLG